MIKNKKGISHIEVIISLVIFIGFLIFLFVFLKPVRNREISQTILDTAENGILDFLEVDYNYISVKLKLLTQGQTVPEYVNAIYVFLITFLVALVVLHSILFIVGKNNMYHYYFGNIRLRNTK